MPTSKIASNQTGSPINQNCFTVQLLPENRACLRLEVRNRLKFGSPRKRVRISWKWGVLFRFTVKDRRQNLGKMLGCLGVEGAKGSRSSGSDQDLWEWKHATVDGCLSLLSPELGIGVTSDKKRRQAGQGAISFRGGTWSLISSTRERELSEQWGKAASLGLTARIWITIINLF
eukprot:Gb_17082 [translate_table: standard]